MTEGIDPLELAEELAEIARATRDPRTGQRLMSVVTRLLERAGLPPAAQGGGEPPTWLSEPVFEAAA